MAKGIGIGLALGGLALGGLLLVSRAKASEAAPLPVPPGGGGTTPVPPDGGGGGPSLLGDYPAKDVGQATAYVINKGQALWGVINGPGLSDLTGSLTTLGMYLAAARAYQQISAPGLSGGCQSHAAAAVASTTALEKYGALLQSANEQNAAAVIQGLDHDLTASLTLWAELQTGLGSRCQVAPSPGPAPSSGCETTRAWAQQLGGYVAALAEDCKTSPSACESLKDYQSQLDKVKAALAACGG